MLISFKDNAELCKIIIKTNYSLILSTENLLHLAERMEDIRENQCEPPKNLKCRICGNNLGKQSPEC